MIDKRDKTAYVDYWNRRREQADTDKVIVLWHPLGTGKSSRFHVIAPYSIELVAGARALNGRWRARSKVWSFDKSQFDDVMALLCKVYSQSNVEVRK